MNQCKSAMIGIALAALVLSAIPSESFACDKSQARQVLSMLNEMGTWTEKNDKVSFYWGSDWGTANAAQKQGLLETFANADACITSRTRDINFYYQGRLVGRASPGMGITLLDR